jgi:hypothetical protein
MPLHAGVAEAWSPPESFIGSPGERFVVDDDAVTAAVPGPLARRVGTRGPQSAAERSHGVGVRLKSPGVATTRRLRRHAMAAR